MKFQVIFLKSAKEFLDNLDKKPREKILFNIWKIQKVNDSTLFKKITDEIWEIRCRYAGSEYRLLTFWDRNKSSNTLVVATHGFIKKYKKIPKKEIARAEQLRIEYLKL